MPICKFDSRGLEFEIKITVRIQIRTMVSCSRPILLVAIPAILLSTSHGWVPPTKHVSRGSPVPSWKFHRHPPSYILTPLRLATVSSSALTTDQLSLLDKQKYIVIDNFLPQSMQDALRQDIRELRGRSKFKVAKIGQDATNTLNQDIRVAETCFIGPSKLPDVPSSAREELYSVLDRVRADLGVVLDPNLTELLYAYYPKGGFYRRHRDAIPGSASTLRKYSLLLYLNEPNWDCSADGGALRIHLDSGGDELPEGEDPKYVDISPTGGTLVLFPSDGIPHEVLDTAKERMAVVGWYNRPLQASDAFELGSNGSADPTRLIMLAVAAGLVTVGVAGLVS